MVSVSPARPRRSAEKMPTGMAIAVDRTSAIRASGSDTTMRSRDEIDDRHGVGVGAAEIERQHAADPVEVAPDERLVEAHLPTQRRQRLRRGVEAEHQLRRIARQHFQHGKDDERRDEQRRDADAEALQEIGEHGELLRWREASLSQIAL